MFETFTRTYGEKELPRIIAASTMTDIDRKLESAQLEAWLSSGKSVEDVFDLLRLNLTKDDFFKNPVLSIWVSYLNTIVTDNPNKMSEVLSFLKTRFTTTPLLRTLAKAKQFGKRSY
ncbi:hypothetical protein GN958_ATG01708 [Phytophthora infestans]|uniref:RxLR effector PexRD54 WY domain-containing protein n=1 Tax=Phytophthora infestans TaxID=4787 RepID=A0A8S9VAH4_PHYIN|nr:hypothetical protein GN958_ATG01708 [Phytophthora infestans]